MADLTKTQKAALRTLGKPGEYRVNWRPKLSARAYRDLLDQGMIEEVWTWASGTRPDVGITPAGAFIRDFEAEYRAAIARAPHAAEGGK